MLGIRQSCGLVRLDLQFLPTVLYRMTPLDAASYVSSDGETILSSMLGSMRAFCTHDRRAALRWLGAAAVRGAKMGCKAAKTAVSANADLILSVKQRKRRRDETEDSRLNGSGYREYLSFYISSGFSPGERMASTWMKGS